LANCRIIIAVKKFSTTPGVWGVGRQEKWVLAILDRSRNSNFGQVIVTLEYAKLRIRNVCPAKFEQKPQTFALLWPRRTIRGVCTLKIYLILKLFQDYKIIVKYIYNFGYERLKI